MASKLLRILIVALLAAGVFIPAALILTQQRASAASMVLSVLDGTAEVARGTAAFARAGDGHVLVVGDRVRTSEQGHAVVTFLDGSTQELEPATTITIDQAAVTANGAITIQIQQALGRTWSSVQKLARADSKFEIRTPSTTATVRGTGFVTDVLASGATTVTTTDGIVEVSGQGQTVVVPAGSFTTVQPSAPPTPPQPSPRAQNTLRFGLHSPAHLVVVDGFGRACGIVPSGPTVVRQIPGCLATEAGIDPQLVDLPNAAPGNYAIFVESIAPGGDFVATASALDGAGGLSFNYSLNGSGPAGTKFSSTLRVESGPDGALTAAGLSRLSLVDRVPTRVVVMPSSPRPTAGGTPNASVFALLPRFGFTAGLEVTPPPSTRTPTPSATPSLIPTPTPTDVTAPEPTPPVAPARGPTPRPISTPDPTPAPTVPPTASPTASPAPTGPTVVGGIALRGGLLTVTGRGWSTARITISWVDGRPLVQTSADASGDIAVPVTVPFDTTAGTTYRITASDGRQTATGQVTVYTPAISVSCGSATASVRVAGNGWPASGRYVIRSSLLATPLSGTVGADGTFSASFIPSSGTLPGDYQMTASVGTLLAEPRTCTLR
jgi:hypothetical protein